MNKKPTQIILLLGLLTPFLLTSCATIIGGSKYYAHVVVTNNPNAKIIYNDEVKGIGSATFKVERKAANIFTFKVKEDGCPEQIYTYTSRSFRGWALAGTIIGWTGVIGGVPIPWGVGVDLATGALWKPNKLEKGISKETYKQFRYTVNYTASCSAKQADIPQQLIDVVYLKNGSIIKGIILEQIPNVQLKLQTSDGSIFVFKMEEVEKITREQSK